MRRLHVRRASAAFSLVEVALALGLAGFCLVAVMALLPVGVNNSHLSVEQTAANGILTHVLADLRATPAGTTPGVSVPSQEYAIAIPANTSSDGVTPRTSAVSTTVYFDSTDQPVAGGPSAAGTSALNMARYRLTINFLPPPTAEPRAATWATLVLSWPAAVDPTVSAPAGRVQVFAALDRN